MKNICLIIEYIGTNYCGFQRQRNGISIQQVLEEAIFKAINQKVNTVASGRTDAGVHALNQVVNFSCSCNIPSDKIHYHINQYLPKDIRIKKSFEVDENFNSRKSAISKTYFYKIYNGKNFSVFDEDRSLFFPYKLDFYLLNKGATLVK